MNRWTTKTMWMTVFPALFFPLLAQAQVVMNTNDSGSGSLRQVVADAASNATITFAPSLNGETIVLFEQIVLDKDLVIDAEALPRGVGISGNSNGNRELEPGETRIFLVQPGRDVRLRALTLRDGQVDPKPGAPEDTAGGAILNWGSLLLERCLIVGCSARIGGGIYNAGDAKLTLVQTTITGNHASESGGAIYNTGNALVTLEESTLSANLAETSGGGVWTDGGGVGLTRTILAGNQAPSGEDLEGGLQSQTLSFVGGDPGLLPLADHGGPVETLMPRSGSPVLDAAGTSPSVTDARGQPRNTDGTGNGIALADIGAVEFNPVFVQNLNASGPGSLRDVVAGSVGDAVMFLPSLNGGTIVLDGENIPLTQDMVIDATGLPNRITISGNSNGDGVWQEGESRIFITTSNTRVTLRGLHLTMGQTDLNATGFVPNGGAIFLNGEMILDNCLITGCSANSGGAIFVNFNGNLSVRQSTIVYNTCVTNGAAIVKSSGASGLDIHQSTITQNTAGSVVQAISGFGDVTITNSIVAGNGPVGSFQMSSSITVLGGNNILSGDPRLAPLGFYNRPVLSMPPLSDSPAVDAGGPTPFLTDIAGMPRALDGSGNGVAVPDIGAAEMYPSVVSQTGLTGFGSLPEVMEFFSDVESGTITFAPALSGGTILLEGSPIVLNQDINLDGSMLAEPLTLSGGSNGDGVFDPGESRVFEVPAGVTATLRGLRIGFGQVPMGGSTFLSRGGLVLNRGVLTLDHCELLRGYASYGGGVANMDNGELTILNSRIRLCNAANDGGAVHHEGSQLTILNSTLDENKALNGGGLANLRAAVVTQSTFYENSATNFGGAISHSGFQASLTLTHCTITGNTASTQPVSGGIRIVSGSGDVDILSSIVAGNSPPGTGNIAGTPTSVSFSLITGDPQLMPFGNNGGPTPTLPPAAGSPALGGADPDTPLTTDQRGWPRQFGSAPDVGAVERWPTGYYAWISSFYPGETDLKTIGPEADPAEDGVANVMKFAFGIPPMADSSAAHPRAAVSGAGAFGLEFERSVSNFVLYSLEATDDLMEEFLPAGAFQVETTPLGHGREVARFFLNAPPGPHLFLRLKVDLPE